MSPGEAQLDAALLRRARDYALTGDGSGCVIRGGRRVIQWGDQRRRYDLKSTTKSFGATALGLAIDDGQVKLHDPARKFLQDDFARPQKNVDTGWLPKVTLFHLATHTAGFAKPGGYSELTFEPGTKWLYSDCGPNWIADCLTCVYRRDLRELMFERVFTPLDIGPRDLTWRRNQYRERQLRGVERREFGSGISANVDAMARLGLLYLRRGQWRTRRILSAEFVDLARATPSSLPRLPVVDRDNHGRASQHYGLLWWNNSDGSLPEVPRDAYWTWGLYDSLIVVIPSLDLVAARAGRSWQRQSGAEHYDVLEPFLTPIARAAGGSKEEGEGNEGACAEPEAAEPAGAPAAPSPVIAGIRWSPAESIVRRARGSDNWPLTSGDDGWIYTAYGDGRGFRPPVPEKLSLGLARVRGEPSRPQAENIRSETAEQRGDGAKGRKASGLLMVGGTLYMWARNAGNSQLAWSEDHGRSWQWSDWKFQTSFGCPTFLNYGPNYAGATDQYVYIYSQDADTAYRRADRMVLARVPKAQIRQRERYELLERVDDNGQPHWTDDIRRRGAVFENPGRCYRSSVSYHAGLGRYLWCQTGAGEDTRFAGGLAIYDAPHPWGPWTTVYFTGRWDVGPGETQHLPTAWMGADNRTVHLVFSGDDTFAVRRGQLQLR